MNKCHPCSRLALLPMFPVAPPPGPSRIGQPIAQRGQSLFRIDSAELGGQNPVFLLVSDLREERILSGDLRRAEEGNACAEEPTGGELGA